MIEKQIVHRTESLKIVRRINAALWWRRGNIQLLQYTVSCEPLINYEALLQGISRSAGAEKRKNPVIK